MLNFNSISNVSRLKIILCVLTALGVSACGSSDQSRVETVNITGDGVNVSAPVRSAKYNAKLSTNGSMVVIPSDARVAKLEITGNSNVISVRKDISNNPVDSVVDTIVFTGTGNKVILPFEADEVPVTNSGSGNVVENCASTTKPDGLGGCIPDRDP